LISEQPFGTLPRPNHLVARDRIQSALSVAVVVGQSGIRSGTMHTVRYAAAQGRPVFCPVPHAENGASEGLRVLLEAPAGDLWQRLPAWKTAKKLCAQLGSTPLARAVNRESLDDFIDEVHQSARAPGWEDDRDTLFAPPVDH
jgi:predicted Rossmann fold nucleotide-binding protein DprA/Smf involved in DNA uptake